MQYGLRPRVRHSTGTCWKLSPQHMAKECLRARSGEGELAQDRSSHLHLCSSGCPKALSISLAHSWAKSDSCSVAVETKQTGKHCIQKCSVIMILKSSCPSSTSSYRHSACMKAAPRGFWQRWAGTQCCWLSICLTPSCLQGLPGSSSQPTSEHWPSPAQPRAAALETKQCPRL